MAGNPYNLYINRPVSYRTTTSWMAARVVSITDQDNVVLRVSGARGAGALLNGGAPVPRRGSTSAAGAEINTWRPY